MIDAFMNRNAHEGRVGNARVKARILRDERPRQLAQQLRLRGRAMVHALAVTNRDALPNALELLFRRHAPHLGDVLLFDMMAWMEKVIPQFAIHREEDDTRRVAVETSHVIQRRIRVERQQVRHAEAPLLVAHRGVAARGLVQGDDCILLRQRHTRAVERDDIAAWVHLHAHFRHNRAIHFHTAISDEGLAATAPTCAATREEFLQAHF